MDNPSYFVAVLKTSYYIAKVASAQTFVKRTFLVYLFLEVASTDILRYEVNLVRVLFLIDDLEQVYAVRVIYLL